MSFQQESCMHASREEAKSIVNSSLIAHSSVCVSILSLIAHVCNKVVETIDTQERPSIAIGFVWWRSNSVRC